MPEVKERLIQESESINREIKTGMVDVAPRAHVPENVKSWLEKIETDPIQPKQSDDNNTQPTLQLAAPQDPRIQLPVTRQSFLTGFAKKIDDAGKWLSIFLLRMVKMHDGKVKFKEE